MENQNPPSPHVQVLLAAAASAETCPDGQCQANARSFLSLRRLMVQGVHFIMHIYIYIHKYKHMIRRCHLSQICTRACLWVICVVVFEFVLGSVLLNLFCHNSRILRELYAGSNREFDGFCKDIPYGLLIMSPSGIHGLHMTATGVIPGRIQE